MVKIRTMTDERDSNSDLLSDEMRLTRFRKSLRALSIDELPSLINIIKEIFQSSARRSLEQFEGIVRNLFEKVMNGEGDIVFLKTDF